MEQPAEILVLVTLGRGETSAAPPAELTETIIRCAELAGAVVTEPFLVPAGPRARDRRQLERGEGIRGYVVLDDAYLDLVVELAGRLVASQDATEAAIIGVRLGGLLQRQAQEIVFGVARERGAKDLPDRERAAREANSSRAERKAEEHEAHVAMWRAMNATLSPLEVPRSERARIIAKRAHRQTGEQRAGKPWPSQRVVYDYLSTLEARPRRR